MAQDWTLPLSLNVDICIIIKNTQDAEYYYYSFSYNLQSFTLVTRKHTFFSSVGKYKKTFFSSVGKYKKTSFDYGKTCCTCNWLELAIYSTVCMKKLPLVMISLNTFTHNSTFLRWSWLPFCFLYCPVLSGDISADF